MNKIRFCSKVYNGVKRFNFVGFVSLCDWVGSWATIEERDFFWKYPRFFYWVYRVGRVGRQQLF